MKAEARASNRQKKITSAEAGKAGKLERARPSFCAKQSLIVKEVVKGAAWQKRQLKQ